MIYIHLEEVTADSAWFTELLLVVGKPLKPVLSSTPNISYFVFWGLTEGILQGRCFSPSETCALFGEMLSRTPGRGIKYLGPQTKCTELVRFGWDISLTSLFVKWGLSLVIVRQGKVKGKNISSETPIRRKGYHGMSRRI